jgi:predicted aconitase
MELTKDEEKLLNGDSGEAMSTAYRILLAVGEATDAEKLVPIEWAHISGVNYNTIGDAGRFFLEKISVETKVAVKTTLNPMGFDRDHASAIPERFFRNQIRIIKAYASIGAKDSFTCIPYEMFELPERGSSVSFAESNAAILSNSIHGLLTNKESSLSALASAITGKSPYSDLRVIENRVPRYTIKLSHDLSNELDYGLLGYFAGKEIRDSCVAINGITKKLGMIETKSLSASMGTSGSVGMFVITEKKTGDIISYDRIEAKKIMDELNTEEDGDVIVLGSPQLGMTELKLLATITNGKKFSRPCMIFCPRKIRDEAKSIGLVERIVKSGVEFMCDSCMCLTPLITRENADSIITNSIKGAYYMKNSNNLDVSLKDLRTIVRDYTG